MNPASRLLIEYSALAKTLEGKDMLALATATVAHAPEILRTGRLTAVDIAMSRNMTVRFDKARIVLPLAEIDAVLATKNDSPTFGNVREIYARNCYLDHFKLESPQRKVLDLGANRGMFSLLALAALGAETVVGVEPTLHYAAIQKLLLDANGYASDRAPRYTRFISSPSVEAGDPEHNVSIQTILREQKIDRFDLVKIDIEGHEKGLFSEPEWLASVDTIAMEMHPHKVRDLSIIPQALERYGFQYVLVDQAGKPVGIESSVFLFASCIGALAS